MRNSVSKENLLVGFFLPFANLGEAAIEWRKIFALFKNWGDTYFHRLQILILGDVIKEILSPDGGA